MNNVVNGTCRATAQEDGWLLSEAQVTANNPYCIQVTVGDYKIYHLHSDHLYPSNIIGMWDHRLIGPVKKGDSIYVTAGERIAKFAVWLTPMRKPA